MHRKEISYFESLESAAIIKLVLCDGLVSQSYTMSIFVSNLDDFIAPSQACVNPLVSSKLSGVGAGAVEGADATANSTAPAKRAVVTLSNDYSTSEFTPKAREPDLIRNTASSTNPTRRVATVSVADCLACRCVHVF